MLSKGGFSDAVIATQAATRSSPKDARAWQLLGSAYHARSGYVAALAAYGRALELSPTLTFPKMEIATLHERLGNTAEAINHFDALLALNPQYVPGAYRATGTGRRNCCLLFCS